MHHGRTLARRRQALAARMADVLDRAERSSPEAAQRRAVGAGLYGESAHRAIMLVAMRAVVYRLERMRSCFGPSVFRRLVR
jgi:hypothetical protein